MTKISNELDDKCDNECVNRDSFRESDSQNHSRLNLWSGIGISSNGFHSFGSEHTDGNGRAHCTDGDCKCDVKIFVHKDIKG